jgi:hypothetical protein
MRRRLSNATAKLSRPVPYRKRLLGSGSGTTFVEAENDVITFTPLRLCEVSTKVARPIPLTIPDIVNAPVPEAEPIPSNVFSLFGPISTRSCLSSGLLKRNVFSQCEPLRYSCEHLGWVYGFSERHKVKSCKAR